MTVFLQADLELLPQLPLSAEVTGIWTEGFIEPELRDSSENPRGLSFAATALKDVVSWRFT